jgi:hypothetical protein
MHSEKPTQLARDEIAKIQKNDDKLLAGHLTDLGRFQSRCGFDEHGFMPK